jgi:hypothetical protein
MILVVRMQGLEFSVGVLPKKFPPDPGILRQRATPNTEKLLESFRSCPSPHSMQRESGGDLRGHCLACGLQPCALFDFSTEKLYGLAHGSYHVILRLML